MTPGRASSLPRGEHRRGIALLEALVALAILALAIAGIVSAASAALRGQASARAHREAISVADAQLGAMSTASTAALAAYASARQGVVTVGGRVYRWSARAAPDADSTGMWIMHVSVAWDDGGITLGTAVWRPPRRLPGSASP